MVRCFVWGCNGRARVDSRCWGIDTDTRLSSESKYTGPEKGFPEVSEKAMAPRTLWGKSSQPIQWKDLQFSDTNSISKQQIIAFCSVLTAKNCWKSTGSLVLYKRLLFEKPTGTVQMSYFSSLTNGTFNCSWSEEHLARKEQVPVENQVRSHAAPLRVVFILKNKWTLLLSKRHSHLLETGNFNVWMQKHAILSAWSEVHTKNWDCVLCVCFLSNKSTKPTKSMTTTFVKMNLTLLCNDWLLQAIFVSVRNLTLLEYSSCDDAKSKKKGLRKINKGA